MKSNYAQNMFDNFFSVKDNVKNNTVATHSEEVLMSKGAKNGVVDTFLEKGEVIAAQHDKFKNDVLVRGNKALYELLSLIYSYALEIDSSKMRDKIIEALRKDLKINNEIKTTTKTPFMTVIVKFIVKDIDRQTAHNYSRTLRIAQTEGIKVGELTNYIVQAGGVTKVTKTSAEKDTAKIDIASRKNRVELLRRALVHKGLNSKRLIDFDDGVWHWAVKPFCDKEEKAKGESSGETGDFVIFITVHDETTNQYKVVVANDFCASFEKIILRHMASRTSTPTESLQNYVEKMDMELEDKKNKLLAMARNNDNAMSEAA